MPAGPVLLEQKRKKECILGFLKRSGIKLLFMVSRKGIKDMSQPRTSLVRSRVQVCEN